MSLREQYAKIINHILNSDMVGIFRISDEEQISISKPVLGHVNPANNRIVFYQKYPDNDHVNILYSVVNTEEEDYDEEKEMEIKDCLDYLLQYTFTEIKIDNDQ